MARKKITTGYKNNLAQSFAELTSAGVEFEALISSLVPYQDSDGLTNDDIFLPVTDDSVQNLMLQIQKVGFNEPINVWELPEGKYMIFSGHRRVRAMELLGKGMIPARKFNLPDSEAMRRRMFLGANIASRGAANSSEESDDIYVAKQMKYLGDLMVRLENFQGSERNLNQEIAKEFGKSFVTVWRYKQLLKLSDHLLAANKERLISLSTLAPFADFSYEVQDKLADMVRKKAEEGERFNRQELEALAQQMKEIQKAEDLEEGQKQAKLSALIGGLEKESGAKAGAFQDRTKQNKTDQVRSKNTFKTRFQYHIKTFSNNLLKRGLEAEEKKELVQELQELIQLLSQ